MRHRRMHTHREHNRSVIPHAIAHPNVVVAKYNPKCAFSLIHRPCPCGILKANDDDDAKGEDEQ